MQCPVCKSHGPHTRLGLRVEGFSEDIVTCVACSASWSVNHGMTEMIVDPQQGSFLSATGESVEADDYNYAA